jgi:hypothetical protein
MTKNMKIIILALVVVAVSLTVYSRRATTFEDCVLKNIENSKNDQASRMVLKVCRDKFPQKQNFFDQFDDQTPAGK